MSGSFSSAMLDLDYIAPSNACIKPTLLNTSAAMVHRYEPGKPAPIEEIVKISLQDCLACSGCITTAETMLITSQSKDEVLREVAAPPDSRRPMMISISDQSAASIAVQLGCSVPDALKIISGFCRDELGASFVVDLRWAQRISQEQTAKEFIRRVREQPDALPLIVSACPGIVCYFEKTHPNLLPFLCPVMSSQGIAGAYAKKFVDPSLYHVSIQPCFDKKLEAVRDRAGDVSLGENGMASGGADALTDCVLSTQELLEWMREVCPAPQSRWSGPLDTPHGESLRLRVDDMSQGCEALTLEGSGGFHQFAMQAAAVSLVNTPLDMNSIKYVTKRNSNHRIATADVLSGMNFCVGYGFQHVQNIVRGLNRPTSTTPRYSLIELMACPDGCLNGGGQVRTQRPADTLFNVKGAFQAYSDHVTRESSSPSNEEVDGGCSTRKYMRREGEQSSEGLRRAAHFTSASLRQDWLGAPEGDEDGAAVVEPRLCTRFVDRKKDALAEGGLSVHTLKW